MIEAHATDAWTRMAARSTSAFRTTTFLGGFAAPLFLWLAGLGVALSASRTAAREGHRAAAVDAACRRGLEVFVLAFLFRLQAFIVSPGSHPVTLFRVDILNVMGPATAVAGLVWGCSRHTAARVALYGVFAAGTAMMTPIVREAHVVASLPVWVQWYLRPSGEDTTFTLFPWAGFVFAGGAVGALLAASSRGTERRLHLALLAAGSAVVAIGLYSSTRPNLYPSASFWTSSPAWFAIRVGVLMVTATGLYGLERLLGEGHARRFMMRLQIFGRSSLFVYWIHVELVYGYATWMIHRRLALWGALVACAIFSVAMYGAVKARDGLVRGWPRPADRGVSYA
jgi:uncharacterized membrane protein